MRADEGAAARTQILLQPENKTLKRQKTNSNSKSKSSIIFVLKIVTICSYHFSDEGNISDGPNATLLFCSGVPQCISRCVSFHTCNSFYSLKSCSHISGQISTDLNLCVCSDQSVRIKRLCCGCHSTMITVP